MHDVVADEAEFIRRAGGSTVEIIGRAGLLTMGLARSGVGHGDFALGIDEFPG